MPQHCRQKQQRPHNGGRRFLLTIPGLSRLAAQRQASQFLALHGLAYPSL